MNRELDKAIHAAMALLDLMSNPSCQAVSKEYIENVSAALLKAYDEARAEERAGGWIACSERMPERGVEVLFYALHTASGQLVMDVGERVESGHWSIPDNDFEPDEVTHWQPLPGAPG